MITMGGVIHEINKKVLFLNCYLKDHLTCGPPIGKIYAKQSKFDKKYRYEKCLGKYKKIVKMYILFRSDPDRNQMI